VVWTKKEDETKDKICTVDGNWRKRKRSGEAGKGKILKMRRENEMKTANCFVSSSIVPRGDLPAGIRFNNLLT
jgi:hypothetical protein